MIFFTLEFAIVFLLFFCLYWALKHIGKIYQNALLLLFNYAVLLWINPYFALVVAIYTLVIYLFSSLIYMYETKIMLTLSLGLVVLNLAFFKYFASIKDGFDTIFMLVGLNVIDINILFPLGLSFYTFASITYLVSVAKTKRVVSLFSLATFLSFFPTFISGPIMRSDFFFAQLHKERYFGKIGLIFTLVLFGLFKKVLCASYLQTYSDSILQNPADCSTLTLLLGIYAYSIRLYCDFSGYVDLVSAFALMLGFTLPQNFNMPYAAKNIKDFWGRWHMSLSLFIRDYIYIPLGGNKKGFWLAQLFVLISFGLSGIWHGNTYNFLIWGLLHGLGTICFNCIRSLNLSIPIPYISTFITFHFVTFAWVFFYYTNFEDALFYLESFVINSAKPFSNTEVLLFFFCAICFILYPLCENMERRFSIFFHKMPIILQPFVFACCFIIIIGFAPSGIPNFIYAGF
ncbi:MBOAT family O-acyltransferase [Helicobacter trogontum]|uniref:MBOAT family protein n=1 Tax=Helicobacter trogontum TaxID=50960 RepID=A0A4U8T7X2_9HELI|nr:MBOAT family O-acyltransferase [Helicobacter trogontum]TLD95780.1 MBOAT family protein [Helicobacter trogontum]